MKNITRILYGIIAVLAVTYTVTLADVYEKQRSFRYSDSAAVPITIADVADDGAVTSSAVTFDGAAKNPVTDVIMQSYSTSGSFVVAGTIYVYAMPSVDGTNFPDSTNATIEINRLYPVNGTLAYGDVTSMKSKLGFLPDSIKFYMVNSAGGTMKTGGINYKKVYEYDTATSVH